MNTINQTTQKTFAQNLRTLRKQHKLTMKQLAQFLDFSQAKISNLENEQRSPHIEDIVKIANFFEITTDELLGVSKRKLTHSILEYNDKILTQEFGKNHKIQVMFHELSILSDDELDDIRLIMELQKEKRRRQK